MDEESMHTPEGAPQRSTLAQLNRPVSSRLAWVAIVVGSVFVLGLIVVYHGQSILPPSEDQVAVEDPTAEAEPVFNPTTSKAELAELLAPVSEEAQVSGDEAEFQAAIAPLPRSERKETDRDDLMKDLGI